jgi:hypothetical protein
LTHARVSHRPIHMRCTRRSLYAQLSEPRLRTERSSVHVEDALRRESSVPVELGHHLDETSGVNLGRPRGVGLLYPSSSTSRR